jgi:hypothetical protein
MELTTFPGNREEWIARIGTHSDADTSKYSADEKLVFSVLEAIDFECWKYGDAPSEPTQEQAKQWLTENRAAVREMKIEPPSYLGAFAGVLDFLAENVQ